MSLGIRLRRTAVANYVRYIGYIDVSQYNSRSFSQVFRDARDKDVFILFFNREIRNGHDARQETYALFETIRQHHLPQAGAKVMAVLGCDAKGQGLDKPRISIHCAVTQCVGCHS